MNILSKKSNLFIQGALFGAVFFLFLTLALVFAPKAIAGSNSPSNFTDEDGTECAWIADSLITCAGEEFWFDYDKSVNLKRAVYRQRTKTGDVWGWAEAHVIFDDDGEDGQIVKDPASSERGTDAFILDRSKRKWRQHARDNNPADPDNTDGVTVSYDGETNPNNSKEHFMCGLGSRAGHDCWSGIGGGHNIISVEGAALLAGFLEKINSTVESEEECTEDAGSLGFVLCPILDTTRGAVKALIGDGTGKGFLVELLTIRPLSTTSTPELYNGWQVIRNIALGLYILIFVLIIFGNGIGYDPYTIKRALPRLAAGVVLTFASWWIMQTLVDLSNLVGNVVPALVSQMSGQAGISNYSIDLNPAFGFGSIILLIIVALIALGALLIGVAGLVMRVVIIYGLVLLAPLAFLAWVLPNTEGIFKKWWQNLTRVLMMFPIVTGMLALSLFFQQIMLRTQSGAAGNTGSVGGSVGNSVTGIVGMLAPLIAIILIPKTFKWGGAMFAAAAGYMAAKATQGKDWGNNQGRNRIGSSMKDGAGAKGLRAIGTKKAYERDDDGNIKLDENGRKKFKREPRMGVSRIPGIGGVTATKSEVATARREARIKGRAEEGIKDINQDGLQRIYQSMNGHQRSTPRGLAVKTELDKKRGEMLKDYAEAVRTGNDTSFFEGRIKDIDNVMGGNYTDNTEARMNNINVEDRRSKGISLPSDVRMDVPKAEAGSAPLGRVRQAWRNRAGNRGQGGYVDPSAFSRSTGRSSTSPPPSGNAPVWNNPSTTPPPYTGPAAPAQPAPGSGHIPSPPPPTPGGGGALPPTPPASTTPPPFTGTLPPSTTPPTSPGDTVYNVTNEVTNNVTHNVSTSRSANQTSPPGTVGGPVTIPSGALGDLARQFQMMRARGGSSDGAARLESKINTLQDMIAREGRNSNNVKNLMRTMREEANNLPSHEQGVANDALSNFEHQAGINGPDSSDGTSSGDI